MLIISKRAAEEEIRKLPSKECFVHLELSDWELQKQVLEKVRNKKITTSANKNEELEMKPKHNVAKVPTFLFSNMTVYPKIEPKSSN